MPKFFPGVTHAIVKTVADQKDMDSMAKALAHVYLCFGPGDETSIGPVRIKKMEGPTAGVVAQVPKVPMITNGVKSWDPIVNGKAADEIKLAALVAFDRVKSAQGLKFNKSYRVAKEVEEIVTTNAASNG